MMLPVWVRFLAFDSYTCVHLIFIVPGFTCQGNEFSHYMLLASYFILNKYVSSRYLWIPQNITFIILTLPRRTTEIGAHKFYPYVHSFSNIPSKQAILQEVSIPDVLPSALPPGSNFSLVAGPSGHRTLPFELEMMNIFRWFWRNIRIWIRSWWTSIRAVGRRLNLLFYWYGGFTHLDLGALTKFFDRPKT